MIIINGHVKWIHSRKKVFGFWFVDFVLCWVLFLVGFGLLGFVFGV